MFSLRKLEIKAIEQKQVQAFRIYKKTNVSEFHFNLIQFISTVHYTE
jgi:hypothetical protein